MTDTNKFKVTPGPWIVLPGVYDTNPETASEFPHGPEITTASGQSIAFLPLYSERDACLIAAAPELLEALQVAMRLLAWDDPNVNQAGAAQARAAIAKAMSWRCP